MVFKVEFTNTSGEVGMVITDIELNYSDNINDINQSNVKISGSSVAKRSLIEIGSIVKIYRNDTLEFKGLCDDIDYFDGGGISVHSSGYERWMALENGAYAGSPWSATASATIASSVIGESNYFSAGTVNAGLSVDFRAEESDSLWNVLKNLMIATQQDIGIDYANSEIDILDHKGSATSVLTLNVDIQMSDLRVSQSYPISNYVVVYGKSEGSSRIKSCTTSGQDAGSQSTYGIIKTIVSDPKILTQGQANIVADAEVARYKDPVKVYDFEVLNPNQSLISGDVITLNAPAQGLSSEEVRIVKIERGRRGNKDYMTLQVTNAAYAKLVKNSNEILAESIKGIRDQQTYDNYQTEYSNQTADTLIAGHTANANCIGDIASTIILGKCIGAGGLPSVGYGLSVTGFSIFGGQLQINTGGICMNSTKICCLTDPSAAQDAATKAYVDACVGAGGLWTDAANPWITPCGSCSICAACICAVTKICAGQIYSFGAITSGTLMGATCCVFSQCGYFNVVEAINKMKLPVGTNCY